MKRNSAQRKKNDIYQIIIDNEEMKDKCNKLCPKDCAFIDFKVTKYIKTQKVKVKNGLNFVLSYSRILSTRLITDNLLYRNTCHVIDRVFMLLWRTFWAVVRK